MSKKEGALRDYESLGFENEEIRDMGIVTMEIQGGKYEVRSPIYRRSDDRMMANEGVSLKEAKIRQMKEEISRSLKRGKKSPYYTSKVIKEL